MLPAEPYKLYRRKAVPVTGDQMLHHPETTFPPLYDNIQDVKGQPIRRHIPANHSDDLIFFMDHIDRAVEPVFCDDISNCVIINIFVIWPDEVKDLNKR